MKVEGAKKVHYDSGPNMTPLVDVVMVILIFLMLAGSFAGSTRFLMSKQGIHKTGSGGAAKLDDGPEDIELYIDPAADGFTAQCQRYQIAKTRSATELQATMEALMNKESAKWPADKLQVVLKPNRNLEYQYLIQVYQAVLQAKFTKVAFATSH